MNASEKERLAIQTKAGYRPTHDINGRPIPWNRVYRSSRGKNELPCRGRLSAFRVQMRPAILQPRPTSLDQDSVIIRLWQDVWRHSTHSYASQDPATEEYQTQHRLYRQTMCSITAITLSSRAEWLLGHRVCDAIIELLNSQPAMVCDLLLSLIHNNVCQTVGKRALIDAIFRYICKAANNLPEYAPFRRFVLRLDDQASLSRLGNAMAKAKVDTMWMTRVPGIPINQHKRDFFKEVIVYAINIVMDYGEYGFAKDYLDLLLLNNPGDEMLAATYTRLQQKRRTGNLSIETSLANSSCRKGGTQVKSGQARCSTLHGTDVVIQSSLQPEHAVSTTC